MRRVGTVILAAGKGTRMRSRFPKVTHQVGGRAMLEHVLRAASEAVSLSPVSNGAPDGATPSGHEPSGDAEDHSPYFVVVVGHEQEQVRAALQWSPAEGKIAYVAQEPQLGTADAVRSAAAAFSPGSSFRPSTILVLYGDTPLLTAGTLQSLLSLHQRTESTLTFLTGLAPDPTGYGRVLRDSAGQVEGIVEEQHATGSQAQIQEVNGGVYCFEADWLWPQLDRLTPHANGEYYLTDLVGVAVGEGHRVSTISASLEETMGVNDRIQLAEAERIMRRRVLTALMLAGVTIDDPTTTYVDIGVQVGQDSVLRPGTMLRGATIIGERCEIGPSSVLRDCAIGDDCRVLASWLESAIMESGSRVGPMSRLRPGAHLLSGAFVGNFGEVKNSVLGRDVQMHHFSYIGDAAVGASTNIGAGAITMNYDGKEKYHTEIGERVFIGCDTLLRAPITVGSDAATGGGSVVTRDVPAGRLAVGMPARMRHRKSVESGAEASSPPQDSSTSETDVPGREERE